jgi:hypothetical protein
MLNLPFFVALVAGCWRLKLAGRRVANNAAEHEMSRSWLAKEEFIQTAKNFLPMSLRGQAQTYEEITRKNAKSRFVGKR